LTLLLGFGADADVESAIVAAEGGEGGRFARRLRPTLYVDTLRPFYRLRSNPVGRWEYVLDSTCAPPGDELTQMSDSGVTGFDYPRSVASRGSLDDEPAPQASAGLAELPMMTCSQLPSSVR